MNSRNLGPPPADGLTRDLQTLWAVMAKERVPDALCARAQELQRALEASGKIARRPHDKD